MEELFEYKIEDKEVCIIKYLGSSKEVVIPEEIEGYPVKSIGDSAFYNNNLTSVDLTGVESISDCAFFNNNLTSINLLGVKNIGNCVFFNNLSICTAKLCIILYETFLNYPMVDHVDSYRKLLEIIELVSDNDSKSYIYPYTIAFVTGL